MSRPFYIDEDACIADGCCADICTDCFRYEKGMAAARVISFDCDEALVQEAMDTCPVQCIHWQDEE
jgi:ferredoxin